LVIKKPQRKPVPIHKARKATCGGGWVDFPLSARKRAIIQNNSHRPFTSHGDFSPSWFGGPWS